MRLLPLFLTLVCLGYCNGQYIPISYYLALYQLIDDYKPWWFNQTIACNFCGQMTYGVVLSDDVEVLISAVGLYSEYNWCPQYYPYITLDYCVAWLKNSFSAFYRPYYAVNYPFRDYMCFAVCGNSGENYTIV